MNYSYIHNLANKITLRDALIAAESSAWVTSYPNGNIEDTWIHQHGLLTHDTSYRFAGFFSLCMVHLSHLDQFATCWIIIIAASSLTFSPLMRLNFQSNKLAPRDSSNSDEPVEKLFKSPSAVRFSRVSTASSTHTTNSAESFFIFPFHITYHTS